MNRAAFDRIIGKRCEKIKKTLDSKGKEYESSQTVFHNFIAAGKKLSISREKALMGMKSKHDVSVDQLVDIATDHPKDLTIERIDEKIGDSINYLILLEGMLIEDIPANIDVAGWRRFLENG